MYGLKETILVLTWLDFIVGGGDDFRWFFVLAKVTKSSFDKIVLIYKCSENL